MQIGWIHPHSYDHPRKGWAASQGQWNKNLSKAKLAQKLIFRFPDTHTILRGICFRSPTAALGISPTFSHRLFTWNWDLPGADAQLRRPNTNLEMGRFCSTDVYTFILYSWKKTPLKPEMADSESISRFMPCVLCAIALEVAYNLSIQFYSISKVTRQND